MLTYRALLAYHPGRRLLAHGRDAVCRYHIAAIRRACASGTLPEPPPDLLVRLWRQVAYEAQGVYADRPGPALYPSNS